MDWRNRTYCGALSRELCGEEVLLMGWVDAVRDHGRLLFIHLRDIRGIVQVVFDPRINHATYELATELREESAVEVRGKVAFREKGTENPNLETGHLEVFAHHLKVYSKSNMLPFQISEKAIVFGDELQANPENVDEELRLRFRYLDLRRPSVQDIFVQRHRLVRCIREYLEKMNFIEVETPFLTRSTPEGARDYLVPSRVYPGSCYALPQSPQLFKQLLMIGGMDRYYQIARCFRDEDLRPNRQPEFTQLDLEASFVDETFIFELIEELTVRMFAVGGITLRKPYVKMAYEEAMARYGTDRPDLRFDMAFEEATDILRSTGYGIFRRAIANGGSIKGFCVKGKAGVLSKNVLQNEYALKIVPAFGGKGMTWMKFLEGRLQSNIVQFFSASELDALRERFSAQEGDVLMMVADVASEQINEVLCSLRLHVAQRLKMIPEGVYCPLWITDFPLFELKEEGLSSQHHPFTMPDRNDFDPDNMDELLQLKSRAYDLVINGEEVGGGSIRIHQMDLQEKIFRVLGLSPEEVEAKFGFFLKALLFGAPPHAGLALGLDRIVAMILRTASIRDVIAFPKNRRAVCPLTRAPSKADPAQLRELGLRTAETDRDEGREKRPVRGRITPRELPSEKRISVQEVKHVAKLARLQFDYAETEAFQKDLNAILEYAEALRELDTEEVEPMGHVLDLKNVWREDEPRKHKHAESLLKNAPAREKDYFKVPQILEG